MIELQRRDFPADLHIRRADNGTHYAEGLAVPYNVPANILELRADGPISYREQFAPGAFARALREPNRVALVYGHSEGFGDRLGHVAEFTDTPAGLMMRAKLDPSRAEQAIDALTSSHSSLSVAFATIVPKHGTELPGQLVTRRSVHLAHIAAVPEGAYPTAQLLSVREGGDPSGDEPTDAEKAEQIAAQQRRELAEWVEKLSNPWSELRSGV
jgi:HK97 family phage prohead protease